MQIIEQLKINQKDSINILIPDLSEKYNYFLEPTSLVNKYDQIIIEFQQLQNNVEIGRNMLITLLEEMYDILADLTEGKGTLYLHFEAGKIGYAYNNCVYDKNCSDVYFLSFPSALCGNQYYKAWIYQKDDNFYLEIAPLYPWLYKEENKPTDTLPFDAFMRNYTPLFFGSISQDQVKEWLQKCEKIIRDIDEL